MLAAYAGCITIKDKDGNTPLHSCVEHMVSKLSEVVKMLLEVGPKAAEMADQEGNLAIHSAAERQFPSEETLNMLMDAYPEGLKKKDKEGNLPLHSALERGDSMTVSVIRRMLELYPGAVVPVR
jgi:ankyrin repeat protein